MTPATKRSYIGYPKVKLIYNHDRISCKGCSLNPANELTPIYPYYAYNISKILTHLEDHRKQGDLVPENLQKELFEKEADIFPEGGVNKGVFCIPSETDIQLLTYYGTTH